MNFDIKTFIVYLFSFTAVMYAFTSINLEKFIRKNKVVQAQLLVILLCMAIGYLVAQFLFGIMG